MEIEQLYHHGVKGMKWGVRRGSKKTSAKQSTKKKRNSKEDIAKKKVSDLKNSNHASKGRKATKIALGVLAGTTVATLVGMKIYEQAVYGLATTGLHELFKTANAALH